MSKCETTQYELSPNAVKSLVQNALHVARDRKIVLEAKIVHAYSGPVTTRFLWFRKTRPATAEEVEARIKASQCQFSGTFDDAWFKVFRIDDHLEILENLMASADVHGVTSILLSQRDMNILEEYTE